MAARAQRRAATQSQQATARELLGRISAVRSACRLLGLSAEVLKAVGVGTTMSARSVNTVLAAAAMVADAYAKYPEELRSAGILPDDIETINGQAAALRSADQDQESKKVTAKQRTAARRAAQARGERAIAKIVAAAELEFVGNPERLAQYQAIVPARPKRKKPAKPA